MKTSVVNNHFLVHLYRHQVQLVLLHPQEQTHAHQWLLLLLAQFLPYEFHHLVVDNFSISMLVLLPFYHRSLLYAENKLIRE